LLTNFNKAQALPKNAVNPKWQENQKNRYRIEQTAPTNLERSGFVFETCKNFQAVLTNTKQSAAVFLMSEDDEEPHCWIDIAFLHTFDASKV
jgi:hypothetical protein